MHKLPSLPIYTGSRDPDDHLQSIEHALMFHDFSDSLKCRAFQTILVGQGRRWFASLPDNSICRFHQLVDTFTCRFTGSHKLTKQTSNLLTLRQQKGETLRGYIERFNSASFDIPNLEDLVAQATVVQSQVLPMYSYHSFDVTNPVGDQELQRFLLPTR